MVHEFHESSFICVMKYDFAVTQTIAGTNKVHKNLNKMYNFPY